MDNQSQDKIDIKIKDLEEENELLLLQLHQVQEELESYFLKCKELESNAANQNAFSTKQSSYSNQGSSQNSISIAWVDEELPDALAERTRLTTLTEVQQWIYQTESRNGLNARLAKLLTESISTSAGFLSVPSRLISFWRSTSNQTPPSSLGGKNYERLIAVFKDGGMQGAEQLIESNHLSFTIKANAYTALARHLMKKDVKTSAKLAQRAYETDPRAYRLKWLACRVHEAGEVQKADAMIDLLPKDMKFSESESRQVDQIRYEALVSRRNAVYKDWKISEKKRLINDSIYKLSSQLQELIVERDQLKQENQHLVITRDEQLVASLNYQNEIKGLSSQLQELIVERDQLKQENQHLVITRDEQLVASLNYQNEIKGLSSQLQELIVERDQLKQENQHLVITRDEQLVASLNYQNEIKGLSSQLQELIVERDQLKQENQHLVITRDEQLVASLNYQNEIKGLSSITQSVLQLEKNIKSDLKNKIEHSVHQLEAFISIQNYLNFGTPATKFDGWPINPEMGLFLIEKIQDHNYDLIIEFGSGTSSVLLAHGAKVRQKDLNLSGPNKFVPIDSDNSIDLVQSTPHPGIINSELTVNKFDQIINSRMSKIESGIPEVFIFEHDSNYYKKTKKLLRARDLLNEVSIFHAPLTDWYYEGGRYLFYDCESVLKDISARYKYRRLNVLAFIDGPPGSTCKNARFPAVPIIFSCLGQHNIDIVLDDANRPEEVSIIESWRKFWLDRSIHFHDESSSAERGIYFSSIRI